MLKIKNLKIFMTFITLIAAGCTVNQYTETSKTAVQDTGAITTWSLCEKITAPDAENGDQLGQSVSISGDYMIAGTVRENGAGTQRGAAYIYHRTGTNTWDDGFKLTAYDAQDNDFFGMSVSISGDYAIVGSQYSGGTDTGAAYIYHRTGINT